MVSACSGSAARIALPGMASLSRRSALWVVTTTCADWAASVRLVDEDTGSGGMQNAFRFFDSYQMAPSHRFAIALKQSHQDAKRA